MTDKGLGLVSRRLNIQTGLGVDYSDNHKFQDGLINNRGQVVIHELGIACTCRGGDRSDPVVGASGKLNCRRCENGILFRQPRQIMGLIVGIGYGRQLAESGFLSPGDCLLSVSSNLANPPSDFDKITFTWPENINDGQVIVRGADAATTDLLSANEDRLHYVAAKSLYVEDEDGVVYNEGADFHFEARKIIWTNPPEIDKRYSIKYMAYLEWIVFVSPTSRRDKNGSLGYRIGLRKKHAVNLRNPIGESVEEKLEFNSRVSA